MSRLPDELRRFDDSLAWADTLLVLALMSSSALLGAAVALWGI